MIIIDLEHLETVSQLNKIDGGKLSADFANFKGVATSNFLFDSLVIGKFGAFAGGEKNILTTASPGQFTVGFAFNYQAVAIGYLDADETSA